MEYGQRKRRRYDSDDEDDDGGPTANGGAPAPAVPSAGHHTVEDTLLEDIDVDDDLLERFGVHDLIAGKAVQQRDGSSGEEAEGDDEREARRARAGASGSQRQNDASDASLDHAETRADPVQSVVAPHDGSVRTNATHAKIDVARHVRRLPRDEVVAEDGAAKLRRLLEHARQQPEAIAADAVLAFYRKRKGGVGTAQQAAAAAGPSTSEAPTDKRWENRFGVAPGWRWDGVVRGTGAEEHYFPVH